MSSARLKAMVDAVAEKEKADFDLMITAKENKIRLQKSEEKKFSLALKAHRKHVMAVLKAR